MSILHPRARKAAIAFIFVTAVLDILAAAGLLGWRVGMNAERAALQPHPDPTP